jgi:hypothetical protein
MGSVPEHTTMLSRTVAGVLLSATSTNAGQLRGLLGLRAAVPLDNVLTHRAGLPHAAATLQAAGAECLLG